MVVELAKIRAADRRLCRRLEELAKRHPELVNQNTEPTEAAEEWLEILEEHRVRYETQLGIRVSEELIKRLDGLAERLEAATPGAGVTRTTAARVALERGLELLEEKSAPAKAPKTKRAR